MDGRPQAYFTTSEPEDRRKEARQTFVCVFLSEKRHTSGQTVLKDRPTPSPTNKSEMKCWRWRNAQEKPADGLVTTEEASPYTEFCSFPNMDMFSLWLLQ